MADKTNIDGKYRFRVGQRVCRIGWSDGVPFMRFATITKVNTRNYYVDGALGNHWFGTAKEAFEYEYRSLFSEWGMIESKSRPLDWRVKHTVLCVCRLRRMERRLIRKTKRL